jgi:hypothetical protein
MKLGPDPRSALTLSPLERSVLAAAAARLGDAAAEWRAQCEAATVTARSHSGVGFVTKLEVPAALPALPAAAAHRLGAIHASHPELAEPVEFLIQLKDGRLATIEAFCYAGTWPMDDRGFAVAGPG